MKSFFGESESRVADPDPLAVASIYTRSAADAVARGGAGVLAVPGSDCAVAACPTDSRTGSGHAGPMEGRIAVYDSLTAAPRVEIVDASDPGAFIETLAARVFNLAKESGGCVPYTVVRELAENFIHAGFEEAVVTVMDEGNTIRFSDQGPGIPDKERVFSPGFSTATFQMKRVIRGVGSGLPIARECLQFAGGSIDVEDNLGRGTVVTISVEKPDVAAPAPQVPPAPQSPSLTLRQKQVLSLVMELGSVGPTLVAKELAVGLSTAYRDLEALEGLGLLSANESGKRGLSPQAVSSLDDLLRN